jgi:transcriptional regulator with XRE-family HTH domain
MFWNEPSTGEVFDAQGFGQRVRHARERAHLNQTVVADLLGMSQPTYSRLEQGRLEPSRVTAMLLDELSRLLGRPMRYFLSGSPVRDRVRLAARRTDEDDVRERAARVFELLEADADLDDLDAPVPETTGQPRWVQLAEELGDVTGDRPSKAQGRQMAERLRQALGLGDGPISDLPAMLENQLDVDLAVMELGSGLSAVAAFDDARDIALLGVSVSDPYVRQRFGLAHELAHLLFGDGHTYEKPFGESRSPMEMRADKFAQELLIPGLGVRNWLGAHGYGDRQRVGFDDACRLADDFAVSPTTAWIAMADLRIEPKQPAPSARDAAVVSGHLARHRARESSARLQRVPQRMETRFLAAFRAGHLSAGLTAQLLAQDPAELANSQVVDVPARRSAPGHRLVAAARG